MDTIKTILKDSLKSSLGALLLVALLQPFGIDRVEHNRTLFILGEGAQFFLCSVAVGLLLYTIPAYRNWQPRNIWQAFLKMLICYLLVTPILSACLISYNMWIQGFPVFYAWYSPDGSLMFDYYLMMCGWILLVGLFIIIWQLYRFHTARLEEELLDVKAINSLLEARQQQLADTDEAPAPATLTLTGNAQNAHLTLCPDDIIYIESMANYADVVYIAAGETRHATLRITLKQLREQLSDVNCLVQCHRAFMVNLNFVLGLSVRSAGSYELQLFGLDKRIPVSRANADLMKQQLEK